MAYVVTARWTARAGEEEKVRAAVEKLAEPSRAEPGCLYYQPHRDLDDPRIFFFYEQFADEDAYKAHGESEHFQRIGLGEAIPLLENRERAFYETLDV
jgi:quinol monooxygenase YgiN